MAGEWIAQLPEDLRANEAFTGHATLGDFAKSHLDAKGKLTEFDGKVKEYEGKIGDLEGKLTNYIPKPSDKATPEEQAAYRKAIGVPDKPEDYQFPKLEEITSDERMVKWASNLFWKLGLTKEQAHGIGIEWDQFLKGVITEEERLAQDELKKLGENFRKEFGSDQEYKAAEEITRRYWEKITGTKFDDYCKVTGTPDLVLMKFIYENAKKTGEDFSLPGGRIGGGGAGEIGIVYDKSPKPPSQEVR